MDEDTLLPTYPYSWSPESTTSLKDFLTKYRPSMVQNDGTKPWIWARGPSEPSPETQERTREAAESEAAVLLKSVTEQVEGIKNDASIPVRSNKKTGARSKKEVREQVQAEATEGLKTISLNHGHLGGKWLVFAPADKVDLIWSRLAESLISGPLSKTAAFLAKVSTSPQEETANYQHLICIYMPDVYDKEEVTKVMKVLLRNHGVNLSGVKSNLYTAIGLDSKHHSGIPSTIWKNSALMSEADSKALKDEFYAELGAEKEAASKAPPQAQTSDTTETTTATAAGSTSKPKPKLKKKGNDDPFGSDDDDGGAEEQKRKSELQKLKVKAKRTKSDQDVEEEEEIEDDEPPKKRKSSRR